MFGSVGDPEHNIKFTIAQIINGPRKQPALAKSHGKSHADFKRPTNELKNTLDEEIRLEERRSTSTSEDERRNAERQAPPHAEVPTATGTDDTIGSVPRQNGSA